jgi:hypothetical protein
VIKAISLLFAAALFGMMLLGFCGLGFIVGSFVFSFIRLFIPNLGVPKEQRPETTESQRSVKRVALDFMMAERRKLLQAEYDRLNPRVGASRPHTDPYDVGLWNSEVLKNLIHKKKSTARAEIPEPKTKAAWSIALFSNGSKPWPLCLKSDRGIHCFANLSQNFWISLPSHESADRLARMLSRDGRDVRVIPKNALARIIARDAQDQQQISTAEN